MRKRIEVIKIRISKTNLILVDILDYTVKLIDSSNHRHTSLETLYVARYKINIETQFSFYIQEIGN